MRLKNILWPIFDVAIVFLLIFLLDIKINYGFVIILGYQIFASMISFYFPKKMSKSFLDAHSINFEKPDWWIFAAWCLIAVALG